MDLWKQLFVSLLVAGFVNINFAQSSVKENNFQSISCKRVGKHNKLSIQGYVIKLSEVDLKKCENINIIELFAVKKAIIDTDLVLIGQEVQVVIVAPTWEVQSSKDGKIPDRRLIDLSGNNGTDFKEEAKNGAKEGNKNGAHGLAGVPGGPAGSFYGIASKIINAEQLTILANGGKGGKGQNGGCGVDGANGKTYNGQPEMNCHYGLPEWKHTLDVSEYFLYEKRELKIFGKEGKYGARGGNGGTGGMSGKKGSVEILELSGKDNSIQVSSKDGESGLNGTGGKAGLGGQNGKNVIVTCTITSIAPVGTSKLISTPQDTGEKTGMAKSGLEGTSGISLKMRKITKDPSIPQSFPSSINGYKMYIRPYLADSSISDKDILWTFYYALGTEEKITKMYDTLSLVEQFTGLEYQFFDLNNRMNFTSSYESLMNQIENYSRNLSKGEDSTEYRNIVKDLQTDIKKRLTAVLSQHSYYDVNTDLQGEAHRYLLPLTNQLEDFRKTNNILLLLKQKILQLENQMEGGEKLISDVAESAISDLEETLDQELDSLLREITEMSEKEEVHKEELKRNREQLQKTMELKALLGILKIGCGALGIINPALGFVGAVASSAITVIEAKTTGDAEAKVAVIPKALENWAKESEKYFLILKKKQEKVVKEQENFVKTVKQTTTIEGAAVIDKVWAAAARYRENGDAEAMFKYSGRAMMQVYAKQETELTTNLKKLEESKEKADPKKVDAVKIGLRVVKYLKTTSETFKTGSETVISIMKDEKKVTEIDAAIKKSQKALQALRDIEENIYTEVDPLLTDMRTNLDIVEHDLGKMDEFHHAVAKWNVTGTIEKIKYTLNKVTKDFKVNEDINRTFNRLLETFDLLFKMHKILLKKKREESNKIDETNLHIAHASNLLIGDSQLRYALSELQVIQTSNYAAEKYHEWISAFKQFIFPYCGKQLDNILDLNEFRGKGLTNFANFILKNIKLIMADATSEKFKDKKKQVVFRGSNFPDEVSNFSFFTWKNDEHKQAIFNILNGKNTTLVANVPKGDHYYKALKFNRVKILFTTNNINLQEELTSELNNFDVKLTHHGDSKYRCGDDIYEIKNTQTPLEFHYAANSTEREIHLVSRLAKSPYMLSPYATWTIKLLPIQTFRKFVSLQKFLNFVDLELIGNAEYSDNSEPDSDCEQTMKKYYNVTAH